MRTWTEAQGGLRHIVEINQATGLDWEYVLDKAGRLLAKWSKRGRPCPKVVIVHYNGNQETGRDIYNISRDYQIPEDATWDAVTKLYARHTKFRG